MSQMQPQRFLELSIGHRVPTNELGGTTLRERIQQSQKCAIIGRIDDGFQH